MMELMAMIDYDVHCEFVIISSSQQSLRFPGLCVSRPYRIVIRPLLDNDIQTKNVACQSPGNRRL